MSSGNFQQSVVEEAPESEAGDVGVERGGYSGGRGGDVGGSAAVFRSDKQARVLIGRGPPAVDRRKFRYDVVRGKGAGLGFAVTRDDRMDATEAGDMLHAIHVMCGVDRQTEDVLQAFDSALWFCHTVNSASVLNPGRGVFYVQVDGEARTHSFEYSAIRDKLGVDFRRFFRAYADDVAEVNRRVLRDYTPDDFVKAEQWGWLQEVAYDRGLVRYPHLAHDSADACLFLSPVERQALRTSKSIVIGGTPNSADQMRPAKGISSADRYDSSVGERGAY